MKKRSINGNHINMIKGRLGGEGIDSDAALWLAVSTSNMLMNPAAKTEAGRRRLTSGEEEGPGEGRGGTCSGCLRSLSEDEDDRCLMTAHFFWGSPIGSN